MKLEDFDYELPASSIAQEPADRRDSSRLMVLDRSTGQSDARGFSDIVEYLRPGDVLVLNNARVYPARVRYRRPGGGDGEVLFLEPLSNSPTSPRIPRVAHSWEVLLRPAKWARKQERVSLAGAVDLEIVEDLGAGRFEVVVRREGRELDSSEVVELCESVGEMPLPPYIKRGSQDGRSALDGERYQTVFANEACAAAAPTAGLHFTRELLDALVLQGVEVVEVTHQVGLGTFLPLRDDTLLSESLHSEWSHIDECAAGKVLAAKREGRRVVAVGTTCVRALESFAKANTPVPYQARTELFIRPGFEFQIVDALLTNFHLPCSSLLLLVSAFAGREKILGTYERAVELGFRFYSYGDAMLIL